MRRFLSALAFLSVAASIQAQIVTWSKNGGSAYYNGNAAATLDGANGGGGGFVQLWNDNAIIFKSGNQNAGLRFGNATDLGAANWSEKMRLTDAGSLGLGTASPRGRFDIWGGLMYVTGPDIVGTLVAGAHGGYAYLGCNVLENGIAISPDGTVGIGTAVTNGYRFAVNGDAIFTKVKVKPYPWADYVFHASYRLRPLSEVEQYIQQYHHLPEVPTAEEVEKDGLDLGDNQTVLLKKIEEITLYLIEQNKKLEEQSKTQQELIKQVKLLQQENNELKKKLK